MKVAYKKGDLYWLKNLSYREVEILEVANSAGAIKTSFHGWIDAKEFHDQVKAKIGHVEYRFFGLWRREVLE